MLDLLGKYSLEDIITFIILLALSIKGCVSFFDWINDRIKKAMYHAEKPNQLKNNIQAHSKQIEDLKDSISKLTKKIDMLIESDKDDIKAFITRQHHYFCYQKGWIDDYSLDCIERRFSHYREEGGNSFISDLMRELRELPKQKPVDDE